MEVLIINLTLFTSFSQAKKAMMVLKKQLGSTKPKVQILALHVSILGLNYLFWVHVCVDLIFWMILAAGVGVFK